MRKAPEVSLSTKDLEWLTKQIKASLTSKRLHERCLVVLLAANGKTNEQIAAKLKITRKAAGRWRSRFVEEGRAGIESDRPGRGRKQTYTPEVREVIVRMTLREKPANATHWSRTSMAEAARVSPSTVGRIWRENGLKPHLQETFKLSKDPQFVERLEDVIGLYLNPPAHAIVLSCDEKSQIQALDRTQPGLPLKKGRAGTMTHDYVRHGTTTLFAALNVADGKVISQCQSRHRHQEWIKFLERIEEQTPPDREIHLILDNYATHKHPKVKRWLAKRPRFHLHFTPTSASWLNMVERFFRDLSERRLRRGVFHSVPALIEALEAYLESYNQKPTPFVWTATASDVLSKVKRARRHLPRRPKI